MGRFTGIEWANHTFNPWIGCQKVSAPCDNCYAETLMDTRLGRVEWGPHGERKRTSAANWREPLKWNVAAAGLERRPLVFCASLADVFDNKAPAEWRAELFELIRATPNLMWFLLTKRPQNIIRMSEAAGGLPKNAAIATSVGDQGDANKMVGPLLAAKSRLGASIAALSCEPLLGPINLNNIIIPQKVGEDHFSALCFDGDPADDEDMGGATIDWVIVGGESGASARPMHPDWARGLRDQCALAGTPFFFKQWGEWVEEVALEASRARETYKADLAAGRTWRFTGTPMRKVGKKAAGRLLDGRIHDARPSW